MTDTPLDPPGGSARVSLDKEAAPEAAVEAPAETPAERPAERPADAPAPAPAVPVRPGRTRRVLLRTLLLAVPVALAVLAGLLFTRSQDAREVASYYVPSSPPLNAARTASGVLFSYDYRTLDKDFAAGAALSTGSFKADYAKTTGAVVKDVATRYKAVVKAEAVVAGLSSAEPGKVVAVVFVNQSTTSTQVSGAKVDQSRVRMTLVEQGGRWLVSAVQAV